jgi:phosphate starvation-inducible PhoH-like protein
MEIEFISHNGRERIDICGQDNCNLEIIEKSLDVEIKIKENEYGIFINGDNAEQAEGILQYLGVLSNYKSINSDDIKIIAKYNTQQIINISQYLRVLSSCKSINSNDVEMAIEYHTQEHISDKLISIDTSHKVIKTQSLNQRNYVKAIKKTDCTLAIGPKRTGKKYLAIACAIEALNDENSNITRIVITSDDIKDNNYGNKVKNSYLFSIYDILYELIGFKETARLLKANIIEVSQSELMGERVLNNAFIISANGYYNNDIEKQITYMGFGSKMVIIKNVYRNEIDSDFLETIKKLTNEPEISLCHFYGCDIIKKHKLVQKITKLLKIDK